jgi:recombination protein RecA
MKRGIPSGRISVINGLKQTGKSLLLATILAKAQALDAITVFIDNEFAVDKSFYDAIGLDTSRLIYLNLEYIEDILQAIEDITIEIRKDEGNRNIVIGVDSVAGAKTKADLTNDYDKSGYNTQKAIILSQKLPKIVSLIAKFDVAMIFTQQLRTGLGIQFGDKFVNASGGMALDFYASLIIRLKQIAKIKSNDGLVVGTKITAKTEKNRMGPPFKTADFEIYFDSGIDDSKSCLEMLEKYGAIEGKISKSIVPGELLTKLTEAGLWQPNEKFRNDRWRELMNNPIFYNIIGEELARLNVVKYSGFMGDESNITEPAPEE